MFDVNLKIKLKKGVDEKTFLIYASSLQVQEEIQTSDLKSFYRKGMKYVLGNPTREQQIYRERFYFIESVSYLAKQSENVSVYSGPCTSKILQELPQPALQNEAYDITFEVIYTLFKPKNVEYLRMENEYDD
jgi:hypothetical protein